MLLGTLFQTESFKLFSTYQAFNKKLLLKP